MILNKQRKAFIDLTRKQLIGCDLKDNLLIGDKPLDRFFTGFLFPIIDGDEGLDGGLEDEEYDSISDGQKEEVSPVKKSKRYIPPSSAGFSFFITGNNIELRVFYNATQYTLEGDRDEQNRKFTQQK